ncbi:uncharacterized protein LOC125777165 [Bactrocera dorsalis]|uniref:Uncharacterized protein LOC125777165 n=1 Tax=Bactrocera dorsalis TaxID=27457 RepID=A0ABM3JDT3_BACDO|nr:uncharacterized protein LOC125777165 [Bactrocera dorsalis]
MSCNCILCKRELNATAYAFTTGSLVTEGATDDIQRQRNQLHRRRSQVARTQRGVSVPVSGSNGIRRRRRVQVRLYTTEGAAFRRIMVGGSEVRQTPRRARNGQRAAHRRRTGNTAGRNGTHPQLVAPRTVEPESQRRRSIDSSTRTNMVLPPSFTTGTSVNGPNSLLREMATCLLSQATVLSTVVQNVHYQSSGAQQMAVSETQPAARRSRLRQRRQHATAAVGTRRKGTSGRHGNQSRHH